MHPRVQRILRSLYIICGVVDSYDLVFVNPIVDKGDTASIGIGKIVFVAVIRYFKKSRKDVILQSGQEILDIC